MEKIIEVLLNFLSILFPEQICSICMETTLFKKKHKLSCGHSFHTDCIMSWFRTKKNTCPNCRCAGTKTEPNTNNYMTEFIHDDWESHEYVQAFLQNENPIKEEIINAYYIRDLNMDINIESVFNICNKGMNPAEFENQIQHKFKRENEKKLKDTLNRTIENPTETIVFNYSCKFNEYLVKQLESEEYSVRLHVFHQMEEMKNQNNHKGIYSLMEIEDLLALGW